jgi:hypothetical protein
MIAHLGCVLRHIKLADQFREPLRNPLTHDIVIHGPKLVADPRLDFGIEAALAGGRILACWRLYIFHDLFHVSPSVKSLWFQALFSNQRWLPVEANSNPPEKFRPSRELFSA